MRKVKQNMTPFLFPILSPTFIFFYLSISSFLMRAHDPVAEEQEALVRPLVVEDAALVLIDDLLRRRL